MAVTSLHSTRVQCALFFLFFFKEFIFFQCFNHNQSHFPDKVIQGSQQSHSRNKNRQLSPDIQKSSLNTSITPCSPGRRPAAVRLKEAAGDASTYSYLNAAITIIWILIGEKKECTIFHNYITCLSFFYFLHIMFLSAVYLFILFFLRRDHDLSYLQGLGILQSVCRLLSFLSAEE